MTTTRHEERQREETWKRTDGVCFYCGKRMDPFGDFTIDHFIPRKRGGTDDQENLVPACHGCNSLKRDRTLGEFRCIMAGIRRFKPEQLAAIRMVGITDFEERLQAHAQKFQFWFEKEGNQP